MNDDVDIDVLQMDAGTEDDTATGKDGGGTWSPEDDGGCWCRTASSRTFEYGWLLLIGWVVVAWRRGEVMLRA